MPLWDTRGQRFWASLVSGPCVELTGAVCQHRLRYVTSPPAGPMMGAFDTAEGIVPSSHRGRLRSPGTFVLACILSLLSLGGINVGLL